MSHRTHESPRFRHPTLYCRPPPPTPLTVADTLTTGLELDSILPSKAVAPELSITSGVVRPEAMAVFKANRAKVKSIEDKEGSLDGHTRKLMLGSGIHGMMREE